jgi:metal-responsive CopG/Arc/MetJ family transcriptional regulator
MNLKETTVQFREDPKVLEALDRIADAEGVGRSGLLRQLIREKIRLEADSVLTRYK